MGTGRWGPKRLPAPCLPSSWPWVCSGRDAMCGATGLKLVGLRWLGECFQRSQMAAAQGRRRDLSPLVSERRRSRRPARGACWCFRQLPLTAPPTPQKSDCQDRAGIMRRESTRPPRLSSRARAARVRVPRVVWGTTEWGLSRRGEATTEQRSGDVSCHEEDAVTARMHSPVRVN